MSTIEEKRKIFEQRGYNLLSKEYTNNKQYLLFEKDGYKYYNTYNGFIKTDNFKKWSENNPYSIENINLYFKNNQMTCRVISEKYNYEKMTFLCQCGKTYTTNLGNVIRGSQQQCPDCGREKGALLHRKDELFWKTIKELELEILDNYTGMKKSYYFKTKEGYIFKAVAWNLITNLNHQSYYYSMRNNYSLYNMRLYLKIHHPDITLISNKYIGAKKKYEFQCSCGEFFWSDWQWFMKGVGTRCPKCTKRMSNIELKTKEWLEENNIKFEMQKSFEGCKDILPLKFDFYLPEMNIVIEVDGEQHYRPVAFNGNKKDGEIAFQKNKKRDLIKDNYCKNNNIKMLRIPYLDFNKNEDYKRKLQTFIS